jgi:hypothetical protein
VGDARPGWWWVSVYQYVFLANPRYPIWDYLRFRKYWTTGRLPRVPREISAI